MTVGVSSSDALLARATESRRQGRLEEAMRLLEQLASSTYGIRY